MKLRWLCLFLILILAVDASAATNFKRPPVKVVWNTSGDSSVNYVINNYTNNDGGGGYWYEVYSPESDDSGYEWGIIVDLGAVYNLPQNSSKEIWLWADFNGVSGAQGITKGNLTTTATKAL